MLPHPGLLVTGDARSGQRQWCPQSVVAKGEYRVIGMENQPRLSADIALLVDESLPGERFPIAG